ncbi:hypothetical protein BDZ97DRAFT_2080476 [Flammula alnicola]|nr:hypothetical protein BDZ97DRAFT_2080476 [Flammula alnicola]
MGQTHIGAEGPTTATTRQAHSEHVEGVPESIQAARWAQWGSPITRWSNSDSIATHWITTTAVRYPKMERAKGSVTPRTEGEKTEEQEEEAFITPDDADASALSTQALSSEQVIDAESENEFDEWVDAASEVSSVADGQEAPPTTLSTMYHPQEYGVPPNLYEFDGVLLDEERVIGIRTDATGNIEQIDIPHVG